MFLLAISYQRAEEEVQKAAPNHSVLYVMKIK